jgi:Zn-dependent protease
MWAPVLLFSIVAHEYAHAEAAYRQGDDTAYMLGRLTLNPLKHIDPFMTVLFPVVLWFASNGAFTFGAAKPVPVTPRKYRNFRRGDIIVSLAGIATNLALFVAASALFAVVGVLGQTIPSFVTTWAILQRMLFYAMWMNLLLAFFNLLPIPPLDGSHVFKYVLSPAAGLKYRQLYGMGYMPIIAFLLFVRLVPAARGIYLWPAQELMQGALSLVGRFHVSDGAFPP